MEKLLTKIELEIKLGRFDYAKHFPDSKLATRFNGNEPTSTPS
jgi:integrase